MKTYKLIFTIAFIFGVFFISGCTKGQPSNSKGVAMQTTPEILKFPEGYIIYQEYLETLGEGPRYTLPIYDTGIVEATILSITKSEICPYQEEKCSIEPYPNDFGIVRIDNIISYSPFSEQMSQQVVEEPGSGEPAGEGKTSPEYKAQDLPEPKLPKYEPLQIGQEVSSKFLLSVRPVKVVYDSIQPRDDTLESVQESSEIEPAQTVTHKTEPGKKIFKSIPKEGEYLVFTIKIVDYPKTSMRILPGLKEGDKFRTEIKYDGTLHIEEYKRIS